MADKIYLGNGIEKVFDGGGSIISVHLTLNGMKEYFEKYGYTAANGDMRIKLKIGTRRNVGQYGETHTVELDTWQPDNAGNSDPFGTAESTPVTPPSGNKPRSESKPTQSYTPPSQPVKDEYEDDIPF